LLFGSPADPVGPVALRPRLAPGLPLSMSGRPIEGHHSKEHPNVCRTRGIAEGGAVLAPTATCRGCLARRSCRGTFPEKLSSGRRPQGAAFDSRSRPQVVVLPGSEILDTIKSHRTMARSPQPLEPSRGNRPTAATGEHRARYGGGAEGRQRALACRRCRAADDGGRTPGRGPSALTGPAGGASDCAGTTNAPRMSRELATRDRTGDTGPDTCYADPGRARRLAPHQSGIPAKTAPLRRPGSGNRPRSLRSG